MFANGQKENYSRIITMTAVTVSALLQAYVMHVFMNPSNLLSGGFTGIAILIDKIASLYGRQISTSLGMLLLNIPVAFMCMKSISPRFTFYSMLQVFFASFFLKIFHFTVLFEDIMLNVIFGGFLYGLSTAIALKGNASTGGTDFIALFVSNKIGRSIWEYVFAGNCIVLGIFGFLFGWPYAGYSILFQFVSTKTISAFHHRYEQKSQRKLWQFILKVLNMVFPVWRQGAATVARKCTCSIQ